MIVFQLAGLSWESSLTSRHSTVYCGRYIMQDNSLSGSPELRVTNHAVFYQWKQNLTTPTWFLRAWPMPFLQHMIPHVVWRNNLYEHGVSCHSAAMQRKINYSCLCHPIIFVSAEVFTCWVLFSLENYHMIYNTNSVLSLCVPFCILWGGIKMF